MLNNHQKRAIKKDCVDLLLRFSPFFLLKIFQAVVKGAGSYNHRHFNSNTTDIMNKKC